jgi:hypothetical protein
MGFSKIDAAELIKVKGESKARADLTPYREFFSELTVGEAGRYELEEQEKKATIQLRIKKVAAEFAVAVEFIRTKGNTINFIVRSLDQAPPKRTRKRRGEAAEVVAAA